MKRLVPALFAALLLGGCATAPAPKPVQVTQPVPLVPNAASPRNIPSSLAEGIDAYITRPRFAHAQWGIDVMSLDNGNTLYRRDPDALFLPASNAKLYTSALALQALGAGARFSTTLYATTAPGADGTLAGDLILYGGGDPSLGDPEASPDWAIKLADALAARGVRRVRGNLIADDTYFAGPLFGDGWEALDLQSDYGAQAGALGVRNNMVHVKVARDGTRCCSVAVDPDHSGMRVVNLTGSAAPLGLYRPPGSDALYVMGSLRPNQSRGSYALSAPDGALFAGNLLRDALAQQGIALDGNVRALHWPETDPALSNSPITIASIASPPLSQLLVHMLKHSDNRYAQMLLQQVGVATARTGQCADRIQLPQTSAEWGSCAMRAFLGRIGVGNGEAMFNDGSGLSRQDLVTPAATVKLLAWIARQPFANVLRDALPVAGIDGTLKYRMRDGAATDNVQAKTGTLTHVYTLSGFVTDAAGQRLAFSLMLNRYQRPTDEFGRNIQPSPQSDLDAVATMLAESGIQ
ncbi:MAG TPA: D-alanyl-D-alanine carboxypeptidase/D-alanyl-D-alanine-endopeptidase [Rhodanobacteraceae bacterium]|nr:D-alanyl-D-alanine carboxypeptidase/D-alanyl-D-alanine-endopeptidase [Rhodanobacteraceae bacterium]